MKCLLTRQLLAFFIISSMLLQVVVSAADFHFHAPTDHIHSHEHTHITHHSLDDVAELELYDDHHCCHSVSSGVVILAASSPVLPRRIASIPLYSNTLYQTPVFDALIRPPIT